MKKFILAFFIVFAILPQGAGAGLADTYRMEYQDLNEFRYDCRVKEQQLVWLSSQLPTPWEVFKNDVFMTGILSYLLQHMNGTYERHRAVRTRAQEAVVRWLMFDLRNQCSWSKILPAQCLQEIDETNSGVSVGKRCWNGRNHQPYINRWEVVD